MLVQALVSKPAVEALDVGVLVGFARIDLPQVDVSVVRQLSIALPTNSGPLSLRMIFGKPRPIAN